MASDARIFGDEEPTALDGCCVDEAVGWVVGERRGQSDRGCGYSGAERGCSDRSARLASQAAMGTSTLMRPCRASQASSYQETAATASSSAASRALDARALRRSG